MRVEPNTVDKVGDQSVIVPEKKVNKDNRCELEVFEK